MREMSYDSLTRAGRRRAMARPLLRALIVTVAVFVLYFTLPFDKSSAFSTALALSLGLVAIACLLAWQTHAIARSPYPRVRAIESLATSFPLVVLLFSTTYFLMDQYDETSNFSEPMTRIDALYFTVTTFATVGYGDITPVSETARIIAVVQMVVDLILIGLVVHVFLGSVRAGLARRDAGPDDV
ncbi:MAG TPA: potassium channel family protein [Nocardioidaceae bacterium]|jgi:hypothetical protein